MPLRTTPCIHQAWTPVSWAVLSVGVRFSGTQVWAAFGSSRYVFTRPRTHYKACNEGRREGVLPTRYNQKQTRESHLSLQKFHHHNTATVTASPSPPSSHAPNPSGVDEPSGIPTSSQRSRISKGKGLVSITVRLSCPCLLSQLHRTGINPSRYYTGRKA